jgi:hypothetical protein
MNDVTRYDLKLAVILSEVEQREDESKDLQLLLGISAADDIGCPILAASLFLRLGWERSDEGTSGLQAPRRAVGATFVSPAL